MFEYSGLIVAVCSKCGKASVFFAKEPVKGFACRNCHKYTGFATTPVPIHSVCECGNKISGTTNAQSSLIEFSCKCGYPNTAEYSRQKNRYIGIR